MEIFFINCWLQKHVLIGFVVLSIICDELLWLCNCLFHTFFVRVWNLSTEPSMLRICATCLVHPFLGYQAMASLSRHTSSRKSGQVGQASILRLLLDDTRRPWVRRTFVSTDFTCCVEFGSPHIPCFYRFLFSGGEKLRTIRCCKLPIFHLSGTICMLLFSEWKY